MHVRGLSRLFGDSRLRASRATMTEDRLCGLVMLHVHRNDTVGQVNPEVVLKRWDLGGNRTIHLAFTDTVI